MPYASAKLQQQYQRKWCAIRRERFVNEFGSICCKCGSATNVEFDHRDPNAKLDHRIWSWSIARIQEELKKCQLLCALCHKNKTRAEKSKPLVHGTYHAYKKKKCRCMLCKQANAMYEHKRRWMGRSPGGAPGCNPEVG